MACVCCDPCPAESEQGIDCLATEYSQIVLEFDNFGPPGGCACPNELGVVVIDFYDENPAVGGLFCVLDTPISYREFFATFLGNPVRGFYSPVTRGHRINLSIPFIDIFRRRVFPDTNNPFFALEVMEPLHAISASTFPDGNECESCASFLDRIRGETYLMGVFNYIDASFCDNNVTFSWYLQ
jgi:hypothetical protein